MVKINRAKNSPGQSAVHEFSRCAIQRLLIRVWRADIPNEGLVNSKLGRNYLCKKSGRKEQKHLRDALESPVN